MDENCHSHSIMGILLKQIFTQEDAKNQIKATRYYCCWTQLKSSAILSIFVTLPVILTTSVHRIAMSDNVFLRDQESCVKDDYYMIDVFTYARPATNGETGSLHQLVMYITRALEDSGRLDILRVSAGTLAQSATQSAILVVSQSVSQSASQLVSQSVNQSFYKLVSQSVLCWFDKIKYSLEQTYPTTSPIKSIIFTATSLVFFSLVPSLLRSCQSNMADSTVFQNI